MSDCDPYRPQLLGSGPPLLRIEAGLRGGGEAHHDRGNAVAEQNAERSYGKLEGIDDQVVHVGIVDCWGGQEVDRHPDRCDAGESDVLEQDAEEGYPKVRILAVLQRYVVGGGVGSRCDNPISPISKTHTLDSYQHPSRDDLGPEIQADQGHVCSIAVDGGEEESDQGGQLLVDELYSRVPLFHRRERGPGDRCAWPMEVVEDFEHAIGIGEAPESPETPGGEQEE